jgi:hypothetical protein
MTQCSSVASLSLADVCPKNETTYKQSASGYVLLREGQGLTVTREGRSQKVPLWWWLSHIGLHWC